MDQALTVSIAPTVLGLLGVEQPASMTKGLILNSSTIWEKIVIVDPLNPGCGYELT